MDGNGCFYPLSKDDAGQMREPSTLNMLPIKTAAIGEGIFFEIHSKFHGFKQIIRIALNKMARMT